MNKWTDFYKEFFPDCADAEAWVARCEALSPPNNRAKIMMHQAQRLISISDDLSAIRNTGEALRLLFFMICAESIAKLHDKFGGEGLSRKYTRQFFDKFVTGNDRRSLEGAFTDHTDHLMPSLSFRGAVDLLYDVRCDVVHEGRYWDFLFKSDSTPILNTDPDVIANITIDQLRSTIIRGCISAVTNCL